MGLLTGSVSVTRYSVVSRPDKPDFEAGAFREIDPSSEVRESRGFIPFDLGTPYEVGHRRWAFRVRVDVVKPDPTLLRERVRQLVQVELDEGGKVGPKKKRELKNLAEEELLVRTAPRTKILECCLDDDILYIASTAKNVLGLVVEQLRGIEVLVEPKAPWMGEEELEGVESDIIDTSAHGESPLGCRLLRELVGDSELTIEPEDGYVKLQTLDTKVTLQGTIFHDLLYYLEREAEILAAKLSAGDVAFRFDALSYRISQLTISTEMHEHWIERLDERLEKISSVFDLLDLKFGDFLPELI